MHSPRVQIAALEFSYFFPMMENHRYVNLFWYLENLYSSSKTSSIEVPRKEGHLYAVGEKVQARYSGKIYPAVIVTISGRLPFLLLLFFFKNKFSVEMFI